ncbi:hypothetical protein [Stetteria hydrogenophila]
MGDCRIPVAGVGYSTVEAVPFYHFLLGGDALRLLVPPIRLRAPFECDFCSVGELNTSPGNILWGWAGCGDVVRLAKRWGVSMVFLDGVEPIVNVGAEAVGELFSELRSAGVATGIRWQGLGGRPGPEWGPVDAILVDYAPGMYSDPRAPYDILEFIDSYNPWEGGLHVEVAAYEEKPDLQLLAPLVHRVEGKEVPIHVFIDDPEGGGPVLDLYKKLKKRTPYVYMHADPYSELDTQCPNCSVVVAVRTEGVLHTVAARDGKCPKCGYRLLLRRVVSEKTPRRVVAETRGETVWYPLQSLPIRISFSS